MAYYSTNDDISYTPFTADEERHLFEIYYTGSEPTATQARDEIIRRHLKLTAKLAIKYAKRALEDDWAISAGNTGLMQAISIRKFDPTRGARFSTYINTFIRGQVMSAITAQISNKTEDSAPSSTNWFGPEATVTGVNSCYSGLPHINKFAPSTHKILEPTVEHGYEEQDLLEARRKALDAAISELQGLEALVIRRVSLEGKTFNEVAQEWGCRSRQAAEQAHRRAIKRLYAKLSPLRSELV